MLARVQSCAVHGIDGIPLSIEVDNSFGEHKSTIVGLPDMAIRESRERVTSALRNSGYKYPQGTNVINLAPADIRKEGSALDLPIAIGLLVASGQISGELLEDYVIVGELALDGSLRPVSGALCMAIAAREQKKTGILVPYDNADTAGVVPGVDVLPVTNLREAIEFMNGTTQLIPHRTDLAATIAKDRLNVADLTDVKGQAQVKRALTVAAAGGHNILMIGPPGTGKTMLASRLPGILPDMTFEEALETTRIYSVSSLPMDQRKLVTQRPFRSPHHTATTVSIVGGGQGPRPNPGEVSLAHNGVLFMDELPEFNRGALEVLRQPLEEGLVHISRAMYSVTYPSRMMLVVAMNPCPCGCRTDPKRECRCSAGEVQRYMNRLSGPLLDRIDIHIEVPALSYDEIIGGGDSGPTSAEVRDVVCRARDLQRERYGDTSLCNAVIDSRLTRKHCALNPGAETLLKNAIEQLGFSARAYDKLLRIARTLADLDNAEEITEPHIAEAIQYRSLDRQLF